MIYFCNELKEQSPKSFKYFIDFYQIHFKSVLLIEEFEKYPFEFQLGIYVSFFHHINSDLQFYSTDIEVLKECIKEAFATYEEYLFLDS